MKNNKKYKGVFVDNKGRIYWQTEFKKSPDGKRNRFKRYTDKDGNSFKTKKNAYDDLCKFKINYYETCKKSTINLTFQKFLNEIFLPYYKLTVQESTFKTACPHFEMFQNEFGDKKLSDITIRDCEQFKIKLMSNYSPNYAKNLWSRFKKCLNYAEKMEYILTSPCKKLENPKGVKTDSTFWTFDEFKKVLSLFDLSDYEDLLWYTMVWFYYMTGVRVSEGFSLIWSDYNNKKKQIFIHSTLEDIGKGQYVRKERTKTSAGERIIPLDEKTVEILDRWRNVQISNSDSDYIFSKFGKPMIKSTLARMLRRCSNRAGVTVITGKGLRHSHDSFLINVLNKSILEISHRSGRKDVATTLNHYAHYYSYRSDIGSDITNFLKTESQFYTPSDTTMTNEN